MTLIKTSLQKVKSLKFYSTCFFGTCSVNCQKKNPIESVLQKMHKKIKVIYYRFINTLTL